MLFSRGNRYCLCSTAARTLLRLTACCTASGTWIRCTIVDPRMSVGCITCPCDLITADGASLGNNAIFAASGCIADLLIRMGTGWGNCFRFCFSAESAGADLCTFCIALWRYRFDPAAPYMFTGVLTWRRIFIIRHGGRHQTDHHGQRQQNGRQLFSEKSLHRFSPHKSSHLTGTNQ